VNQIVADFFPLVLVLDRSGSMRGQPNTDLERAASTFVNLMGNRDYGAVINFSYYSSIELAQDFTQDKNALLAAINGRDAGGATALYSAIWLGLDITSRRQGARAVIAMTDGGDNDSDRSLGEVITRADQTGIPVFTVGLAGFDLDEYPLQQLADNTGGLISLLPHRTNWGQFTEEYHFKCKARSRLVSSVQTRNRVGERGM
jgi:Ca-activated chloride channel family protein